MTRHQRVRTLGLRVERIAALNVERTPERVQALAAITKALMAAECAAESSIPDSALNAIEKSILAIESTHIYSKN